MNAAHARALKLIRRPPSSLASSNGAGSIQNLHTANGATAAEPQFLPSCEGFGLCGTWGGRCCLYESLVHTLPSGKVMPLPMTNVAFTSLGPPLPEKSMIMSSPWMTPTAFHCGTTKTVARSSECGRAGGEVGAKRAVSGVWKHVMRRVPACHPHQHRR